MGEVKGLRRQGGRCDLFDKSVISHYDGPPGLNTVHSSANLCFYNTSLPLVWGHMLQCYSDMISVKE